MFKPFLADWWLPLQILLVDPDRSPLCVFFDDDQKLVPVPSGPRFFEEQFLLADNCRNTKRINELAMRFLRAGLYERSARRPASQPQRVRDGGELVAQLNEAITRWVGGAEVPPEDIALLTARRTPRRALEGGHARRDPPDGRPVRGTGSSAALPRRSLPR